MSTNELPHPQVAEYKKNNLSRPKGPSNILSSASGENKLILGSRGSQLALWQTEWVKAELEKHFKSLQVEIVIIKTTGDKILDSPLSKIGDKGLFTREIEHAMLEHQIDAAVHSLKDLPTQLPEGLTIGAISKREDVRDVFIGNKNKEHKSFD